jgi:putative tryptophan/tyrosine transport system substrate-binding protein
MGSSAGHPLSRRHFTRSAAGAATLAVTTAHAQSGGLPVIGYLDAAGRTAIDYAAFLEGLKNEGFIPNVSVRLDYHSASGDYRRLPDLANNLVERSVFLMTAIGASAAVAARTATGKIPIVFALLSDPVGIGLIRDLNRPGGNLCGVAAMTDGILPTRLEFLHQLVPQAKRVAFLVNPDNPNAELQIAEMQSVAAKMGLALIVNRVQPKPEIELGVPGTDAIVIGDDELLLARGADLAALALGRRLPAVFAGRAFAAQGGLLSYGVSLAEMFHQAGAFSGLILKGAAPADLPVYQITRSDLIINLRTAKILGLSVPPELAARANAIIH